MIRKFLILLLAVTFTKIALSQQGWYQLTSQSTNKLNSIFFVDPINGYAVGDSGTILKTTNSGLNWVRQIIATSEILRDVHFIGENGFVVGGTNVPILAKTVNGGINWVIYPMSGSYELGSVFMTDSATAYVSGNNRLLKTTNNGISWDLKFMDTVIGFPAYFSSIFFVNANTGFISGNNLMHYGGAFSKTTDGGSSWSAFGYTSAPIRAIYFTSSEIGFSVLGNEYRATKTTTSGTNWTNVFQSSNIVLNSIWFTNSSAGYIAGSMGHVFKTTNSGLNWVIQQTPNAAGLNSIFFVNENTGYAAGNSGTILKTTNGGVIGITLTSTEVPNEYKLFQNYPNPFNPNSKIKFQIPKSSIVKLSVYDVLGKEVEILVKENLNPGTYEVDFDGRNYSSGIYYYSLISGEYPITKRMVLSK